jgi:hypothetical protein
MICARKHRLYGSEYSGTQEMVFMMEEIMVLGARLFRSYVCLHSLVKSHTISIALFEDHPFHFPSKPKFLKVK